MSTNSNDIRNDGPICECLDFFNEMDSDIFSVVPEEMDYNKTSLSLDVPESNLDESETQFPSEIILNEKPLIVENPTEDTDEKEICTDCLCEKDDTDSSQQLGDILSKWRDMPKEYLDVTSNEEEFTTSTKEKSKTSRTSTTSKTFTCPKGNMTYDDILTLPSISTDSSFFPKSHLKQTEKDEKFLFGEWLKQVRPGEEEEDGEAQGKYEEYREFFRSDLSKSQAMAEWYLKSHKTAEFFGFMISHLLAENPSNPIRFLITLLDRCMLYRKGSTEPPLLFKKEHIESLFDSMDPLHYGYITLNQYKTGMFTLGIKTYNSKPAMSTSGFVLKETFIEEAYHCLKHSLDEMIKVFMAFEEIRSHSRMEFESNSTNANLLSVCQLFCCCDDQKANQNKQ